MHSLTLSFFQQPAISVARQLLGKVLVRSVSGVSLGIQIVETEAYLHNDKASHLYPRRQNNHALFGKPGSLYLYYARGRDSLNIRAGMPGDGILIKAGVIAHNTNETSYEILQQRLEGSRVRQRLLSGQTFVCKALDLTVKRFNGKIFSDTDLHIYDTGYSPKKIVLCRRLGIAPGRDDHLLRRFVDYAYVTSATLNPLRRGQIEGRDYRIITVAD